MSEFYIGLSIEEINNKIKSKIGFYGDNFSVLPCHIELYKEDQNGHTSSFEYEHLVHMGLDDTKWTIFRYIGMHDGTEVYHFYNVKKRIF